MVPLDLLKIDLDTLVYHTENNSEVNTDSHMF